MTNIKKEVYRIGKLRFEEEKIIEAFETLAEGLSPSSFLDYLSNKQTDKTSWLSKKYNAKNKYCRFRF